MKKFGSFFLYLCPTAARTFPAICSIIFCHGRFPALGKSVVWLWSNTQTSFTEIYTDLVVLWSNNRFNTSVMILFSLFCTGIFGLWYYSRYEGNFYQNIPDFSVRVPSLGSFYWHLPHRF